MEPRSSSERWGDPSEERLSEEAYRSSSRTRAIHLSERDMNDADETDGQVRNLTHHLSNSNLVSYSKSTPGSFFAEHMESRNRGQHATPSINVTGHDAGKEKFLYDAKELHTRPSNGDRNVFKPLEDHIIASFGSLECVNTSFNTVRSNIAPRAASEGNRRMNVASQAALPDRHTRKDAQLSEMDAKTLLLGDFAENGFWWTGERSNARSPERSRTYRAFGNDNVELVTLRSPRIDWIEVSQWYSIVCNAGTAWRDTLDNLLSSDADNLHLRKPSRSDMEEFEERILESQFHAQRVLLKATETLLKRPGRPLSEPTDLRFLLIILANPLLYPTHTSSAPKGRSRSRSFSTLR